MTCRQWQLHIRPKARARTQPYQDGHWRLDCSQRDNVARRPLLAGETIPSTRRERTARLATRATLNVIVSCGGFGSRRGVPIECAATQNALTWPPGTRSSQSTRFRTQIGGGNQHEQCDASTSSPWSMATCHSLTPFVVVGIGRFHTHESFLDNETFTASEGAFTAGGDVRGLVGQRPGVEARVGWELHIRVSAVMGLRGQANDPAHGNDLPGVSDFDTVFSFLKSNAVVALQ